MVIGYLDPALKAEVTRTLKDWKVTLAVTVQTLAAEEAASYRWQKSTDKGITWADVEGASTNKLDVDVDESSPSDLYRVVTMTDAHRAAISDPIAPVAVDETLSATLSQVLDGTTVIVSANVEGLAAGETAAYRWQQSADNGETWTNYEGGMDPEVAAVGTTGGSGSVGIDYCGVPVQRTFAFGLNLTF